MSGESLYNKETIIVFIQTDFPDPVVPAINKCGIDVKSPITGIPDIFFPSAIGKFISLRLNLSLDIISLKTTSSLVSLGISIPTVFLPGITETLTETELVFLAISSVRLIIFETLMPGAGSVSYTHLTLPTNREV